MARTRVVSGFKPRRGGDGGMPAPNFMEMGAAIDRLGKQRFTYRNTAIVLSGRPMRDCIPTQNPHDRAHGERDSETGLLRPAARAPGVKGKLEIAHYSEPRLYHASEYHEPAPGVLVHQEQVFDDTFERRRRMESVDLFSQPAVRAKAGIVLGGAFRNLTRPRTRR